MDIFVQFSLIVVLTAAIVGFFRLLKQPLILGYIVTGFVLAPFLLSQVTPKDTLAIFSEMGIAILLFIVGLHLSPSEVKSFGKPSVVIGVFQVLLTAVLGFFVSLAIGFTTIESIYIALGLSLSSTIVVLKLISDKKDLEKLYGRLAVGILLLQDLVACVALIFVSAFSNGSTGISTFVFLLLKILILLL